MPRRFFEDSDVTHHGAATENGSIRGGTDALGAMAAAAAAGGSPMGARHPTGGSQGGSSAAIDILAAGRRGNGSAHGGTSAAEALGISRMSGSLRGSHLAQDALNRQFAEL